MKLCISFAEEDRAAAEQIARLCKELDWPHGLDPRGDWLRHSLRTWPEETTHLLVVVSATSVVSWWLPFHLGRATEHACEVSVYLLDPALPLPGYLHDIQATDQIATLRGLLTEQLSRSRSTTG